MLWGALNNLASILNILCVGRPVSSRAELRGFVERLALMLGGEEVLGYYRSCEALHANFFHSFMDEVLFG